MGQPVVDDDVTGQPVVDDRAARRRRWRVAAGVALVSLGFAGVAVGGRGPGAAELAAAAATDAASAAAAQDVSCDTYDDDSTYTPSICGAFDASACRASCTTGWCASLCGASCSRNEGALCAARALGNISALCSTLDYATPPAATATYAAAAGRKSMAFAEGCDHHAYCGFCGETCRNLLTQYPIGAEFISSMNFGPHAMRLLGNLSAICTARLAGPPDARPN